MNAPAKPADARQAWDRWRTQVRSNFFDADPHLQSLLRHYRPDLDVSGMAAFGKQSAIELDSLVIENNRDENLPRLRRWDGQGRRIENVDFHPSYHQIGRAVYGTGLMSLYGEPGRELETLVYTYLFAQNGEGGHACPLACTAGLIKILQQADGDHEAWLERLYDPNYDTHFHGAQFLTEAQGGSDVGANAVTARRDAEGTWRIHGEKWFCSVIDAQLYLLTARPEGSPPGTRGLKGFVVPRTLSDGETNHFNIRRLKYKLGTRSMASAEVDFVGAIAHPVGEFRDIVQTVLNTSRVYNGICCAGMTQRAFREAWIYAQNRTAFGQSILQFPTVARIIARLRTEAYANRSITFFLADLADQMRTGNVSEADQVAWRMLVNLNKFWTAVSATLCIRDAIEVLGGNGAIEEFSVLPRLLRDNIVCEAWEGGHNVLCAQAQKDSQKMGLHRPMFALLERLGGPCEHLAAAKARWETVVDLPPAQAAVFMRDVAEQLRPAAQAAILRAEAKSEGSDPLLAVVIEHLLATNQRGWDPLGDPTLQARVEALVS